MYHVKRTPPFQLLAATLLCISTPFAMAACEKPEFTLSIPDGRNASQEEMNTVSTALNSFVKEGEAFIVCVEENEPRNQADRMRNSMLDEMQSMAAQFNRQLRFFRRANS